MANKGERFIKSYRHSVYIGIYIVKAYTRVLYLTLNDPFYISIYRCPRRKGQYFGRVFLRSNYTDITQNTYIQSSTVTEILAREV
jgi:hypothetical protein